jgi:hypothetical protein
MLKVLATPPGENINPVKISHRGTGNMNQAAEGVEGEQRKNRHEMQFVSQRHPVQELGGGGEQEDTAKPGSNVM